ncbi:response regulator transcription factor [Sutcliffiella rhizosphaerae]|uniref:Transcriptional regulatory protein LnrK n=1 Tax=Sutcliffiella rhizosphaerae TaxID=2880967 RepID=A0ABN8ADJ4_9BACI|nr:response regulator transcription factor [Sutcliffiella rhizosphaerae]CAG9622086.1 Transcriptional regulatory protein LnrK [Sutcliffiella rhizosphaerae]
MINILLAEDQGLVRQGIKMMIEQHPEYRVIAEVANGKEAVEAYEKHLVDLVLMDVRMPVMTGLEATKLIRHRDPNAKVLILTTFADDEYAMEALRMGALGYLLKDADAANLLSSIESCLNGGISIDASVAGKVVPKLISKQESTSMEAVALTSRERSILQLIGEGKNNQEIAETLHLSIGTVKNHVTVILQKLGLRDRTQMAIFAIRNGLA